MTMCPAPDPTEGPPHVAPAPLARNRAVVVGVLAVVAGVVSGYVTAPRFEPTDPSASPSNTSTGPLSPHTEPALTQPVQVHRAVDPRAAGLGRATHRQQARGADPAGSNWDIYLADTQTDQPGPRLVDEPGGKKVGDPTRTSDGSKLAFWAGDASHSRVRASAPLIGDPRIEQRRFAAAAAVDHRADSASGAEQRGLDPPLRARAQAAAISW